ncbi:hypothetical protein ACWGJ9_11025 [Curtobacterium citreum]
MTSHDLESCPPPVEEDRHLTGGEGDVLDLRPGDLDPVHAESIAAAAAHVFDHDHRAMMRAAARLIHLHDAGTINLIDEPHLATIVDAGFGLLTNYA